MTALKGMREASGLSRRDISRQCGINLRSLQDYEQGHKNIAHAKGELLYKLSLALGCTMEELLTPYILPQPSLKEGLGESRELRKQVPEKAQEGECSGKQKDQQSDNRNRLWSKEYHMYGKWNVIEGGIEILFVYDGEIVKLFQPAVITEQTMPWLSESAIMRLEGYVERIIFQKESEKLLYGGTWDEWE